MKRIQNNAAIVPTFLMDARIKLWGRLAELAKTEIMTEAEKSEAQLLAREFWEWQPVEYRLRPDILFVPWGEQDTQPIQRRIMWAAYTNRCIAPAGIGLLYADKTD